MQTVLNNLINQMEANTANSHNEENVYIKNGFKHCKNCKEPLQIVIEHPITHQERVVSCICKCIEEPLHKF